MTTDLLIKILACVGLGLFLWLYLSLVWEWHKEDMEEAERETAGGKQTARNVLGNFGTFF